MEIDLTSLTSVGEINSIVKKLEERKREVIEQKKEIVLYTSWALDEYNNRKTLNRFFSIIEIKAFEVFDNLGKKQTFVLTKDNKRNYIWETEINKKYFYSGIELINHYKSLLVSGQEKIENNIKQNIEDLAEFIEARRTIENLILKEEKKNG